MKGDGATLLECQDVSRRAVVSASLAQEHPFVVALEDCSSTPVLGTNKLVTKFLEDHSKLDLPICLSILNGRSKRVRDLKIKYLPTQDETLQKIYKHSGSSVNWFRKPYAKIYLVTCENIADYKKKVRPRLKELIDQSDKPNRQGSGNVEANIDVLSGSAASSANPLLALTPWLVLYLQGASATPQTQQQHKKVFQMIKDDFNSSKYSSSAMYYNTATTSASGGALGGANATLGALQPHKGKADRVCQLVITPGNSVRGWEDMSRLLGDCVKMSFECRLGAYLSEVRNLALLRRTPGWSFDHFFLVKGSLAHMFEQAHVYDEAIREYYELEVIYTDTLDSKVTTSASPDGLRIRLFGQETPANEVASILDPSRKNLRKLCKHPSPDRNGEGAGGAGGRQGQLMEFDVRQYLFAKRALLMLKDVWASEEEAEMTNGQAEAVLGQKKCEIARLGQQFISSFTRKMQRNGFSSDFIDKWIFSACIQLASAFTMRNALSFDDVDLPEAGDLEFRPSNRTLNRILADLYIYCHSKLLKLGAKKSFDTKRSQRRQKVSKSMIFTSPKPSEKVLMGAHGTHGPKGGMSPTVVNLAESGNSFEEELILMEMEAAVAAAREAAVIAESELSPDPKANPPAKVGSETSQKDLNLLKCLIDRETYNMYVLALAKEAAQSCRMCGRERQAIQLEANNSDILIHQGDVSQARCLLEQQCSIYFDEGWYLLLADLALPQLIECQLKLADTRGLLSSLATWLTMKEEIRQDKDMDEENIQSALSTFHREKSGSEARASGDKSEDRETSRGLVNLHKSVTFTRHKVQNLQAYQNDVAVLTFELDSHFPFPFQVSKGKIALKNAKTGALMETQWIHILRKAKEGESTVQEYTERLVTTTVADLFSTVNSTEGSTLLPGKNIVFAALECTQLGTFFPVEYTGSAYGCDFCCRFQGESANYTLVLDRVDVLDEPERVSVEITSVSDIYQMQIMCLHDQEIFDCRAKLEISCHDSETNEATPLEVREVWTVPEEGSASPRCNLHTAEGGWCQLGRVASAKVVWFSVRDGAKANVSSGKVDVDCEVGYTSAGLRRTLAWKQSIAAISPFTLAQSGARGVSDTTDLVEMEVTSNLPWAVQVDKCVLAPCQDLRLVNQMVTETLYPFAMSQGTSLTLLYFLEKRASSAGDATTEPSANDTTFTIEYTNLYSKGSLGLGASGQGGALKSGFKGMEAWEDTQQSFTQRFDLALPTEVRVIQTKPSGGLRLHEPCTFEWRVVGAGGSGAWPVEYEVDVAKDSWMLVGESKGLVGNGERVRIDCIPLASGCLPCPRLKLAGEGESMALPSKVTVKPNKTQSVGFIPTIL